MPLGGALTIGGAALGAASGIGKAIFGGKELKQTKAELAALNMPEYQVEDEYYTNERLAASLAGQGLTQQAKDYYTEESGRGLGTGISGILQGGGSVNDISRLLDTYNRGIKNVSVEDAERQSRNIQNYMGTAKDLAGQKTMQWAINEYQPYQNKLKELTQRRSAAYQNLFGGIGDAAGGLAAAGTALSNTGLGQGGGGATSTMAESNLNPSTSFRNMPISNYGTPDVTSLIKGLIPV